MLDGAQLDHFLDRGFVVVEGAVGADVLAAVDDEVDRLVAAAPPRAGKVGRHSYYRRPADMPAAADAFAATVQPLADALVAPHRIVNAFGYIQVALNLPPNDRRPAGPHVDGMDVDPAAPRSFTMLAGVCLSDEDGDDEGNLWVWPGSHEVLADVFRRHGPGALLACGGDIRAFDQRLPIGAPTPVRARRGDVLLAHYLLAHETGPNLSARTRRAVYYRLSAEGHDGRSADILVDPWLEYPPVRGRRAAGAGRG